MNSSLRFLAHALASVLVVLLLAACGSPASTGSAASGTFPTLRLGLIAAQVRALCGEPAEITPWSNSDVRAETWIYRHTLRTDQRQTVVGTRDVPAADPVSGTLRTDKVNAYANETVEIIEVTELLMVEGRLTAQKHHVVKERAIQ
jgi:hypothetical protein